MWEYEHSVQTTASPEALWRHWSDLRSWPQWNTGIERIETDGPFAVGTTFTMTSRDEDTVRMRLVEIAPGELFTDEMDAGDFVVRTVHRLEPVTDVRTRIVYRTEITDRQPARLGQSSALRLPPTSLRSSPLS
jgi:uncharacterized protein YndB with AHSA1/START domain